MYINLFNLDKERLNRCKGCNKNLCGNNPATRYQNQKIIQKTVRVSSSNYTMNIGALNVYQKPLKDYYNVNWNQMSDRKIAHRQQVVSGAGTNPGGNSLKRTLTRLRPGALSPGGIGVDIKHNSYSRYLARLKGKAPLRRGAIPPSFAFNNLPFNPAAPIYGGKEFKTNIVSQCNCTSENNHLLYEGSVQEAIENVHYDPFAPITRYADKCGTLECNINNKENKQYNYKEDTIAYRYSITQQYPEYSYGYVANLLN